MKVLTSENVAQLTKGRWIVEPSPSTHAHRVVIDSREDVGGGAFIAIRGERHDGHAFVDAVASRGARYAIVDREIDVTNLPRGFGVLRVSSCREALGSIAQAHRACLGSTRVVAITGSAGKTTTRALVASILRRVGPTHAAIRSFNNEIGVPLTILGASVAHRFLVLELGTNAPGEIASLGAIAQPDVALVTSIGRAHLERLGSLAGIVEEKSSIYKTARASATCIAPKSHASMLERAPSGASRVTFGAEHGADWRLTRRVTLEKGQRIEINGDAHFELFLEGAHNALNAVGAIAVARSLGAGEDAIREGIASTVGESMRFERCEIGGRVFYNDAYNANPDAMRASIATFLERARASTTAERVLVLGDMLELGSHARHLHEELGRFIAEAMSGETDVRLVWIGTHGCDVATGVASARVDCALRVQLIDSPADRVALRDLVESFSPGSQVLLKGSRGLRLERVIAIAEVDAHEASAHG